ncbi:MULTISPECIES: hypothetical protein [Streptomyces]|uniref:hypothetical protein n=1 Tax=Streptomyces lycopersici TaxID=2974589 RepID=UPI0021D34386|nr:hypothetical protein [Streptomyces sp. NEAU-383]
MTFSASTILWLNVRPWWKGGRDPKALLPYGAGSTIGALSTICVGGALGWGASGIAGLASTAGSKGVSSATGQSSASALPTGSMGTLTPEGAVVTVLILVGVALLHRSSGKQDRRRILGGAVTFAILAFLPGVAGALQWLPNLVNEAGARAVEALSKGSTS